VSAYVESSPEGVSAFVRDRGAGFDLDAVPADRLGVRESVIGRMQRHGGRAVVRRVAAGGTEVMLELPAEAAGLSEPQPEPQAEQQAEPQAEQQSDPLPTSQAHATPRGE
jgi:signal transduction histidine kinase